MSLFKFVFHPWASFQAYEWAEFTIFSLNKCGEKSLSFLSYFGPTFPHEEFSQIVLLFNYLYNGNDVLSTSVLIHFYPIISFPTMVCTVWHLSFGPSDINRYILSPSRWWYITYQYTQDKNIQTTVFCFENLFVFPFHPKNLYF